MCMFGAEGREWGKESATTWGVGGAVPMVSCIFSGISNMSLCVRSYLIRQYRLMHDQIELK